MSKAPTVNVSAGSGCLNLLIFIFAITAWGWGLPTPWGVLHIDLFWPAIYFAP